MIVAEMGAYYQRQGRTLYESLLDLFQKYGYFKEDLVSLTFKGFEGTQLINTMVGNLRNNQPSEIGGFRIVEVKDYSQAIDGLPVSKVLKFILSDQPVHLEQNRKSKFILG
jgi:phosphoglucomutase